ncbi:PLP-dependent transferase [Amylocystis lapponica]|nr:PLP-dependent transferase [Amylocystis lapponica]
MTTLDIARVRSSFPALASGFLYADNAGGSQCLADTVARISDYLLNTNTQPGADYAVSAKTTARLAEGAEAARELFNAASVNEVVYGSCSTMLVENLSRAMEADVLETDEIIITGEHESNCGAWKRLCVRRGASVKIWPATQLSASPNNTYAVGLQIDALLPLITGNTRLVAFPACSNVLGSVADVAGIVRAIRQRAAEVGARKIEVIVDCVAYAPHRLMDVRAWDVDYCYFSMYKVYGPHASALYVRAPAMTGSLTSLAHHFLKVDMKPYKLQPGGPGYELVYGCTAVPPYLRGLAASGTLADAFALIATHEQKLVGLMLDCLRSKHARGVRIVGDEFAGPSRVPTISFVVVGERAMRSEDMVAAFDAKGGVGIRYGHFYAYTLVDSLEPKLDVDDGVVRISFVHYSTVEEVMRVIHILEEVLV